jgi:glycosyltransferase involved in cell wall biosynthesis
MKILYIVHQFYPMHYTGTEKFLLNLTTTMQKWGHNVKVLTYSFYEDSFYDTTADGIISKEFFYKGIPVLAFKQVSPPEDLNWGIENREVVRFAERELLREKPDVIHLAHGMRTSEFILAAQRLGIPYVVTLTDFFLVCPKCILITSQQSLCFGPQQGEACKNMCPEFSNAYIRHRLSFAKQMLSGASCVVAPSKFLGDLFKNEFNDLELKIIPYGIDFSLVKRNVRVYNSQGKFIILYAGQLNYHKGVQVLIDAFMQVRNKDLVLKLYGSGPDAAMRNFNEMAKGDKRIEFCGVYKEDQIGEIFSSADIVVIPSNWHENNTIVMREALASHVPCVVSNAGGMIEKIRDGVNGFVFRMGDAVHLKEVLEKIISRPELMQNIKLHLRRHSLTTVEQEAYAYEEEYKRIVPDVRR